MKTCFRCETALPIAAYGRRPTNWDGLESSCKRCESERQQNRRHGMTSTQKARRADAQNGCALCGRLTPGRKGWVVDHDRSCCPGDVSCEMCRRAVLCQWCNSAMGYAHDNPDTLRRMADYLETGTRMASQVGLPGGTP